MKREIQVYVIVGNCQAVQDTCQRNNLGLFSIYQS